MVALIVEVEEDMGVVEGSVVVMEVEEMAATEEAGEVVTGRTRLVWYF